MVCFFADMVLLLTQPLEVELRAGYQGHSFSDATLAIIIYSFLPEPIHIEKQPR